MSNNTSKHQEQSDIKPYTILSPDGITIFRDAVFTTYNEGKSAFRNWKKRYVKQGYYSSNYGRIPLSRLADECSIQFVNNNG